MVRFQLNNMAGEHSGSIFNEEVSLNSGSSTLSVRLSMFHIKIISHCFWMHRGIMKECL